MDQNELSKQERFAFGKNWQKFVRTVDARKINAAKNSLCEMLKVPHLHTQKFLDIGCGSGLFSLAARLLDAHVHSFDFDHQAIEATRALKQRYIPEDPDWIIEQASVLDCSYLERLGQFDFVYSWGVLHHTGAMWEALENIIPLVKPGGYLLISIYNDQGWRSQYWKYVKRLSTKNAVYQWGMRLIHLPLLLGRIIVRRVNRGGTLERGMNFWYDYLDWIGGYPFEVAAPEKIMRFYQQRGFVKITLKTCGSRSGCNEYVFRKNAAGSGDLLN